jgi:hypothetical protein
VPNWARAVAWSQLSIFGDLRRFPGQLFLDLGELLPELFLNLCFGPLFAGLVDFGGFLLILFGLKHFLLVS